MSLLFDRKYSLKIGQPNETVSVLKDTDTTLTQGYTAIPYTSEDYRNVEVVDRGVEITDLQIVANIKGDSNTSSVGNSQTVIKIYNLSSETRKVVENTNNKVILSAGYAQDDELRMLFSGQVVTFETVKEGKDVITYLYCKEGYTPNNYIKVSVSFPAKETTYGDIINYLANVYEANGIAKGDIINDWGEDINTDRSVVSSGVVLASKANPQDFVQLPVMTARPANTTLAGGYSAIGFLHQVLKNVCSQIGYVSYITNGRLFIHPRGFTKTVEQYEFEADQLISIRKAGTKVSGSSAGQGTDGVKIVTFLDGRLDIDKRIKVLSGDESYRGEYKIVAKTHDLDYRRGKWVTTIMCQKDGN